MRFLFVVALLGLGLDFSSILAAKPLKNQRPNIILVMTDDQGKGDLSCLGNKVLRTPNLDALYRQSYRLTNFHVSPTCAPTRSALMTGRHEFQNGVTHTILERERMTLKATTLPQALSQAGYATGIFGKWHLGDEKEYQPENRGFQESFIHGAGGIGQSYPCSCADAPPNRGKNLYFDNVLRHNGRFVQTQGFCTDVFFQAALGWIKTQKETSKPFFVYLTPNAPHGPMIAPEKYKKRFLEMGYDGNTAGRYGMIENIDDNMGLMLKKLQEWKLEENTLLIFMTDNGQASLQGELNGKKIRLHTAGFRTGKGTPFEGGTCVPAFWRWKGVLPEGKDCHALSAHLDLFPTLAELSGAQLPKNQVKGKSLLPILEDPQAAWDERFLFTHVGRWPKNADPQKFKFEKCAVRSASFRLVNNKELYDLKADPGETMNVIEQHPELVKKMRAAYDAWWKETVPLLVNEKTPNSPTQPYKIWYEEESKKGIPTWTPPKL